MCPMGPILPTGLLGSCGRPRAGSLQSLPVSSFHPSSVRAQTAPMQTTSEGYKHGRPLTGSLLPLPGAINSAFAPKLRKSVRRFRRSSKLLDKSLSLPSLFLSGQRPSSAESDKETPVMTWAPCPGDDREEKTFIAHAKHADVPLDIAKQALDMFVEFVSNPPEPLHAAKMKDILVGKAFDACQDLGSMDTKAFGKSILKIVDCKDFSSLPFGFLEDAMQSADADDSGDIDFGEFLYFYYKFSFSEEVMIGPAERKLRMTARDQGIAYDEISKYKYVFDQTDTNKNGCIDRDEFEVLLCRLFKASKKEGLLKARTDDMFREACRGRHSEGLDFLKFIGWYKHVFDINDRQNGQSPCERFYHNIRRVSVVHHDSDQ